MKRNITKIFAALALLVFMMPSLVAWGQVESGHTYATLATSSLPTGWSGSDGGGTSYIKLIASTHYIQTSSFEQNGFTNITIKARKFGGPTDAQALITVSWYENNTETILGTIAPTNTTLTDYSIASINNPTGNTEGYIKIQCKGASNSKGSGVSAVTITYTAAGSTPPTTYTVTYNANVTGVSPIVDTYNEGADVTLRAANTFTNEGYTFEEWNTQADGDGDGYVAGDVIEDIQEDIELYAMWTENTTPTPGGDNITFDFEDDGAHRSNTSNNYTSQNTYSENGATITLMYADAVTTGTPLNGSANILGRIAKNTTNSPTIHIGSIDITNKTITKIEYNTKGVGAMSQVFEYSLDNSNWTNLLTLSSMPTSAATETVDDLSITGTNLYLRWTTTVSASTGSNRDFQLDDIVITYTTSSNPVPTISASNVDIAFDATSGSIGYTINNEPNPAGTMTAAIVEGSTIANLSLGTIVNGTVPFTCDANTTGTERTATVTLTYTYNRETTTQNVTVTQAGDPNAVDNISDITGASQSHAVRGTVVGVNTKGFVLGDGTGYVYVYLNAAPGVSVGDIKKVSGTTGSYNHVIQYTSTASIETATSSNYNNTPAVQVLDATGIAAYSNGLHLSDYVQIEGLLVHSGNYYNITIEGVSSTASISYPNDAQQTLLNALDNKQVAVKGYFAGVSSGHFNVILESIEEVIAEVETPTFSPAAGTYATAQSVTISCATTGATIYYTIDGTEPTNASTQYTEPLNVSTATTIKAVAYDGTNYSNVSTAIYHINSETSPYTVDQVMAMPAYLLPANGIYVSGVVSQDGSNLSSGALNYYISTDGTAGTELYVYKGKNLNNTSFEATTDIQTGDIVTIFGNVVDYTSGSTTTREFASGNYLISYERPETPAQEYTLTVGTLSHVNLFIFGGDESQTIISTADGETTAQVYNGTEVLVSIDVEEGYLFQSLTITDANGDPVEIEVLTANDLYSFVMPASNVTITATAITAQATTTYTLATSITSGKQYIIVGQDDGVYYAMGAQGSNNREGVVITVNGTTASATIANTSVHEFTISSLGTDNHYSIMDATTSEGYLYAASSSKNYLRTEPALDEDGNGDWEITINSGTFSVVASGTSTNKYMRFNNAQDLFACYGSAGSQHPVFLYEKVEPQTYTLTINGYTDVTEGNNNTGYYLIASPVTVDPATVAGMTEGDFDLYSFNQAENDEWRNYETAIFNLEPGTGYLYAKKATTEGEIFNFTLTGTPYSGDGTVTLTKVDGASWEGWNLIGNPFGNPASLGNTSYYRMNSETGAEIIAGSGNIAAMEGVFVVAANDGDVVTFTEQTAKVDQLLNINVNNSVATIDRAIVRFDEGTVLPKFQLNPNNTKVYIAEGNQDYAVVRSAYEGEMPVRFKAGENGTYTISTNAENVEMTYLHLIDNMTGADVDLLATPSYTFDARTTDYTSRFRLVFSGNNVNENTNTTETFAFFNGESWSVSNQGEATLQVVDVMGRIISTQNINGNATINLNETPGIYMMRLVNGNNVKVQKIVVR